MKKFRNQNRTAILWLAALAIGLLANACADSTTMIYTVEFSGRDIIRGDNNRQVHSAIVRNWDDMYCHAAMYIAVRLERHGCRFVRNQYKLPYEPDERNRNVVHFRLKNAEDTAAVRKLITAEGNIDVWETYRLNEIKIEADSLSCIAGTQQLVQEYGRQYAPIFGYVKSEDCETTVKLLNKAKDAIPGDLIFASGKPLPEKSGLIPVYMLKLCGRDGRSCMDGSAIVDAKKVTRKNSGYKYHAVSVTLNDVGAQLFSRITENNIQRELAVAIDGAVVSAPQVIARINGGKFEIAGNFSEEETKMLVNIIKSGRLSVSCSVTNISELKK